ncbi:MBL fold metallo-hydrolase [Candidatus Falkowbacteria bacterium HGW-Falkowbacteria-1]|uniref:MBL fold metallo-hydrolase n=1 Tax=Candidatus Falkowbacteria bacterium HGW-Falkowbacteria-1 TaxID=2013768 RepID=A0A2N2E8G9_9BACT|nr:MAG: MBL fold metallo-hydrolase [Candidatus Falkowbacteria bacterium HGW-Falkowbacteria-1]
MKLNCKKNKIILFVSTLSLLCVYFFWSYYSFRENRNLKVYFLDVGQGDAIFIQTPNKQNIIIDMGSEKGVKELNKIIPWWSKNIDMAIITHPHDDHIAGFPLLIKKYKIKKIIFTGASYSSPLYQEVLKIIDEKNLNLLIPQPEQNIKIDENCYLKFLFPIDSMAGKEMESLNNSSIVIQLICKNSIFLFTGDAEEEIEKKILEKNYDLKSDVLKVGHHGSISSTNQEFLNKIDPKIAIIMVGKNNKFNHPSLRTINKLKKIGAETFRTDLNGNILIISNGEKIYKK